MKDALYDSNFDTRNPLLVMTTYLITGGSVFSGWLAPVIGTTPQRAKTGQLVPRSQKLPFYVTLCHIHLAT